MKRKCLIALALLVGLAVVLGVWRRWWHATHYVVERIEYQDQYDAGTFELVDDSLAAKAQVFDGALVDSRPIGDWEVNKSSAVIKLDCPSVKTDTEGALLVLRASYAESVKAAQQEGLVLLPSANMLDGAAKQFDDGLYAALDLTCFRGKIGVAPAVPDLIRTVFDQLGQASPARPFLAAALELAGRSVDLSSADVLEKMRLIREFDSDKARSKPIAFYNWTPELQQVWRLHRFLQREFREESLAIPLAIAAVLRDNPDLLEEYRAINEFYGRLTNPLICMPVDVLIGDRGSLRELARKHGARRASVAVLPPSTSREAELFDRLFSAGIPPNVNLMGELIRRIRLGQVNLTPEDKDGWYQYRVYALETMLLPSRGQEEDKLLLTAKYKRRLVEAFKALMTKRRETHARHAGQTLGTILAAAPLTEGEVRPRLRLEPCATFCLRTARAYAFLQNFLLATVGGERLAELQGLKKDGVRHMRLADELEAMRRRFYGFYVVACEDIGMRPQFLPDEPVDEEMARKAALSWLENFGGDPDLACDTRVAVPILVDPMRDRTTLWATLGVRLSHLEASYARPPFVRPTGSGGTWQSVEPDLLGVSRYVIPVDDFAEFDLPGSDALTRAELRAICDQYQTKDDILRALAER
ncbi:MAG: hypothetical protein QGH74_06930 [Candidatus Brocadiia bacterium]|jgi:hypothetical protein|nr:hypothetical protein [Candidatus Brocadiia bacterium]